MGVLHDETPFAMHALLAFMAAFTLPLEVIASKPAMLSQPIALARTPAFVSKQLAAPLMPSCSVSSTPPRAHQPGRNL